MDSPGVRAAIAGAGKRRAVRKRSGAWRKRLHRRKPAAAATTAAAQPPTMQSADKRRPKKIGEEWEPSAVWPSSRKPPQEAPPSHNSRRAAGLACSLCKDGSRYAARELARHFEERHAGSAPLFPCHMCTFKAHELSYLQVHLLSHKDTFSSCNLCDDNVKRSWSELSAHLAAHHCRNGEYTCEACRTFSTGEVRLFLEHVCEHLMELDGGEDVGLSLGANHAQKTTTTTTTTELLSISKKPKEPVPKVKPRLTRSAVREMCWLTQDCLSLPGREFLDKYCHLSDPQTTLEETQQFLMKSVAGETDNRKWTEALKSVLSGVPPDMNLHPRSDNGIVSGSADLTVLTVKNKITVAPNGATYAKRLRMTASAEKEAPPPESAAGGHSHCNDLEAKPMANDNGPMQKKNREKEENTEAENAHPSQDGLAVCPETAVPSGGPEEQTPAPKAPPTGKRRKRRPRRSKRSKTRQRRPPATALKIVLKKNPVKEKQWVSQSSLTPAGGGGGETTTQLSQNAPAIETRDRTKALQTEQRDAPEATAAAQPQPGGPPGPPTRPPAGGSPHQEKRDDAVEPPRLSGSDASGGTEGSPLVPLGGIPDPSGSDGAGATPPSSPTKPRPLPQPAITPPGERNSGDIHLAPSLRESNQGGDGRREADVAADGPGSTELPAIGEAIPQEASPPAAPRRHRQQPAPKSQERTLKLIAIKPSQLVKRPTGDQPVVVLNHPDADIPEVTRIMEVIHRYSGEVQKVVLSRRTLSALSAAPHDEAAGPARPPAAGSSVRERFSLKLKLRRLSRKKYEVVGGASVPKKFRCWFCGRSFGSQETWMVHRQRHLMDWKRPNCENS